MGWKCNKRPGEPWRGWSIPGRQLSKNFAVYLDIWDCLTLAYTLFHLCNTGAFGHFFASIILASNVLKHLRSVIVIMIFKQTEIRAVLDRDEDEERAMEAKAEVTWLKI